jgi:hypothetical protein
LSFSIIFLPTGDPGTAGAGNAVAGARARPRARIPGKLDNFISVSMGYGF